MSEGAHARTISRYIGCLHICGFQRAGCLGGSSESSKYTSGKHLRQAEATEASRIADEVRARQAAEGITTLERGNYRCGRPNQGIVGKQTTIKGQRSKVETLDVKTHTHTLSTPRFYIGT